MRFCSLKFQILVRKIDLVNRRWMVYSRVYGIFSEWIAHGILRFSKSGSAIKNTLHLSYSDENSNLPGFWMSMGILHT